MHRVIYTPHPTIKAEGERIILIECKFHNCFSQRLIICINFHRIFTMPPTRKFVKINALQLWAKKTRKAWRNLKLNNEARSSTSREFMRLSSRRFLPTETIVERRQRHSSFDFIQITHFSRFSSQSEGKTIETHGFSVNFHVALIVLHSTCQTSDVKILFTSVPFPPWISYEKRRDERVINNDDSNRSVNPEESLKSYFSLSGKLALSAPVVIFLSDLWFLKKVALEHS